MPSMPNPAAPGDLEIVRTFLNSADLEAGQDEIASPDALAGWLVEAGLCATPPAPTRAEVGDARDFREALRELAFANCCGEEVAPESALATLERIAARTALRPRFCAPSGVCALEPLGEGIDAAFARLLGIVYRAMVDGSWQRFKACRKTSCRFVFFDRTKNRSGQWCSMAVCGNRVKAQRRRARFRAEP
ncbi:MAG: CGNR zinc finger domain-containing protein [Vulcanimicrobiaceae bacterium]